VELSLKTRESEVALLVYDLNGRLVSEINKESGHVDIESKVIYWDGKNAYGEEVVGVYFFIIKVDGKSYRKRMVSAVIVR